MRLGDWKQATVKPEILHFPPFLQRSLIEETGYKRPVDLFDGPCILSESGANFGFVMNGRT